MSYGLHVIKNPSGTYGFVGSLPIQLGNRVVASTSDIMAGRSLVDKFGLTYMIKYPVFETEVEAVNYAANRGFAAKTN